MKSQLNEDGLTEELARSLEIPAIRGLFLSFLFGGKVPAELNACDSFKIAVQFSFSEASRRAMKVGSRGRLDLLIVGKKGASSFAVGVEHKVWDEEKPSRLQNYRLLLNGEKFDRSWLFEIVREKDYEIEEAGYVQKVYRWSELHAFLASAVPKSDRPATEAWRLLAAAMEASGALIAGQIQRGLRNGLAVSLSAEACLDALLSNLDGIVAKKIRDKGISVHIRTGMKSWATGHFGHWHQRLWIFVKEPEPGVFAFQLQLIFHNANFTDLDFAVGRLPKWAPAFEAEGLKIYRGPNSGWDGAKRVRVASPFVINTRPKYFYAEEPEDIAFRVRSDAGGLESLVASAQRRVEKYLALFDSVY